MKETVHLLYSPGIPATYSMELNIDLRGRDWSTLETKVWDQLQTQFFLKPTTEERGAELQFYYHNNKTQCIPMKVLNDAAQKIVDGIVGLTLYQAKQGELACKFPGVQEMNRFVSVLGGWMQYPKEHLLSKKLCFFVAKGNPNTVYIQGKVVPKNKQLEVLFPNVGVREKFMHFLDLNDNLLFKPDPVSPERLLIDISAVDTRNTILTMPLPFCCTDKGFLALARGAMHTFFKNTSNPTFLDACVDIIGEYLISTTSSPNKSG